MSTSGSAQISPRILAAYERLDEAVGRLKTIADKQSEKVNVREVEILQGQIDGLKQDNFALSEALEAYSEADYDTQFEQLKEKLDVLENENGGLKTTNENLKEMNSDFSERLSRLIGNVQHVLEEE